MTYHLFPVLYLVLFFGLTLNAQTDCSATETTVVIELLFDQYPSETTWVLTDTEGTVWAQSGQYAQGLETAGDTICVPADRCLQFTINDQYSDGMCCGFGEGSYTVYLNGTAIATGGDFGSSATHNFNCAPGSNCEEAIPFATDTTWTTADHTWYTFQPAATGNYLLSSCGDDNTCPTNIWVYEYCANLGADSTNLGTIYFNSGACGTQSEIIAGLDSTKVYYLRVGSDVGCTQDSVFWTIQYEGPVMGCTDPSACNYNPLATITDGACIYPGDPECPDGPDLVIDQSAFLSSLFIDELSNSDDCMIQEGCLGGYGVRNLLRFDTRIDNIGNQDYYIGQPPANPNAIDPAWEWDLCHGHWHYEGYAEYVVYDLEGNELPLGFKNGFCVMDIDCWDGAAKYSCGDQGITAGCGDIYDAYLPCQWFDITDLAAGTYTFVVRTNWNKVPDVLGRHELDYNNNWAQACLTIQRDSVTNDLLGFVFADDCAPFVDCAGEIQGNAVPDCSGDCGGTRLTGDLNQDALRDQADAYTYLDRALAADAPPTACDDLNADGRWTVTDLALLIECSLHEGQPALPGHAHSPCEFPFSINNPYDTVSYEIMSLSAAEGYADIGIHPQSVPLAALQLEFSGVAITGVTSSTEDFVAEWRFDHNTVAVASFVEDVLEKSTAIKPLCRVYFAPADTVSLCFEEAISVNSVREETVSMLGECRTEMLVNTATPNQDARLSIYPNPANERVYVLFDTPGEATLTATLLDAAGQVQRRAQLHNGSWTIDTRTLPGGVYWVRLENQGAPQYARVVVAR